MQPTMGEKVPCGLGANLAVMFGVSTHWWAASSSLFIGCSLPTVGQRCDCAGAGFIVVNLAAKLDATRWLV
jgi:hypothetical protein